MRHLHLLACSALLLAGCQPADDVPADGGFYGPPIQATYIIEFGEVAVGEEAIRQAAIRAGKQAVLLSPPEVEPPFFSDVEQVVRIEPREELQVHFAFRPTALGRFEQEIELRTNGASQAYRLQGVAVAQEPVCEPAPRTDHFPDVRPRVDVLLLVDDHASMEPFREQLVAEARALPPWLDEAGIDWQLAVTTSSSDAGCAGGSLLGDPPILAGGADASDRLEAVVGAPGCDGNGNGLASAAAAVAAAGDAFRRPEAGLALLVVASRDDNSPGDVVSYARSLEAGRQVGTTSLVRALAVVGGEGGHCEGTEPGSRYGEAVSFLGGSRRSLCDEAWGLADFFAPGATFGMPLTYPLERLPIDLDEDGVLDDADGEIEVRIDGAVVASRNEEAWRVWDYDADRNAVVFYPHFVPAPGQGIEIAYEAHCD